MEVLLREQQALGFRSHWRNFLPQMGKMAESGINNALENDALSNMVVVGYQAADFAKENWKIGKSGIGEVKTTPDLFVTNYSEVNFRKSGIYARRAVGERIKGFLSVGELAQTVGEMSREQSSAYRSDALMALGREVAGLWSDLYHTSDKWKGDVLWSEMRQVLGEDQAKFAVLTGGLGELFNQVIKPTDFWREVGSGKKQLVFDNDLMRKGGEMASYKTLPDGTQKLVKSSMDVRRLIPDFQRKERLRSMREHGILDDSSMVNDAISFAVKRKLDKLQIGTDVDRKRQLLWDFYVRDGYGFLTTSSISASALIASIWMVSAAGMDKVVEAHRISSGSSTLTLGMMTLFGVAGLIVAKEQYGKNALKQVKELVKLQDVKI